MIKGPLEGSKGKVIEVRQKENKVFVEGVNIVTILTKLLLIKILNTILLLVEFR